MIGSTLLVSSGDFVRVVVFILKTVDCKALLLHSFNIYTYTGYPVRNII